MRKKTHFVRPMDDFCAVPRLSLAGVLPVSLAVGQHDIFGVLPSSPFSLALEDDVAAAQGVCRIELRVPGFARWERKRRI